MKSWIKKIKQYFKDKDNLKFKNKMEVLYRQELLTQPHTWEIGNLDHGKGRAIYVCSRCEEAHTIKSNDLFNTDSHYQILKKTVGPCIPEKLSNEHLELGGES